MIKLIIFDLDGTLADTLDDICDAANEMLTDYSFPLMTRKDILAKINNGPRELIRLCLPEEARKSDAFIAEALSVYKTYYNRRYCNKTSLYSGIKDALSSLYESGVSLAVLSNKPESSVLPLIEKFFPENTFAIIKGQTDGVPRKPDPTALFDILKNLNAAPHECLYVGDTSTDMQTGKNAGVKTVGVLWGFREKEELIKTGADLLATTPKEILSFI
jgi:phosphoglycolate phosphatase